ncbi:patatin-like phospholipase family protein [Clostridiisalibacter paucivorans]|uniref:patatin-like phospholipase family protein n=1 Tax=Clostridiisalibacter paucivorans TaxID=408753 RepID=UPI00047A09B8|nr:patatin-like phospholipase family protein [Clostridiisalibacter paucivorans]
MIGLVLEGGGARGAYEIGAAKAIYKEGYNINGVTGTSIGALNGAMIVQGDLEKAYDMWYNICPSKIFDIDEKQLEDIKKLDINIDNISYIINKAKTVLYNKGVDTKLIRELLKDNINERKIRKSNKDFGVVTFSISDLKPLELFIEDIPRGKLVEYLMASANFPVFKREKSGKKLFVDGGIYNNLPLSMLVSKGYKELIAIRAYGPGRYKKIDESQINVTYISPIEDLGGVLDFSTVSARKNLQLGYYDAIKVIEGLKGRRYYVRTNEKEDFFLDYLLNIEKEKIEDLGNILGFKGIAHKRMLLEYIVPKLCSILDIDENMGYSDIVINIWELMAERIEVDRFRIYNAKDFLNIIKKSRFENKRNNKLNIPEFIRKNDFFTKVAKDRIIDEILSVLF